MRRASRVVFPAMLSLLVVFAAAIANLPKAIAGGLDNIIPTPQFMESRSGELPLVENSRPRAVIVLAENADRKEKIAAEHLSNRVEKIAGVRLPLATVPPDDARTAIVIGNVATKTLPDQVLSRLSREDREFLNRDKGSEQDYVIDCIELGGRPVVALCGSAPQGAQYAAMSLLHTITRRDGRVTVPKMHIRDYPDIEFRWINSHYDMPTPQSKIDYALEHKINVIRGRLRGSAEERLRISRYARDRGVRLLTILYGDLGLKNRRGYPGGPTYKCMAEYKPNEAGYCVSNADLIAAKQRKLREFVDANEPGCLYIHFLDIDFYNLSQKAWMNRCADCKRRWPNDALEAADGQTGAQAAVFDKIVEAINGVKHPDRDYEAARDCLIMFVSAPYTRWSEPDEMWDKELACYTGLSRLMKPADNVHFCIRENGIRQNGVKRVAELAEKLDAIGRGHKLFTYFHCADRRTTLGGYPVVHCLSRNFTSAAVMTKAFEGSDSVLMAGSGHPLIDAEYTWNLDSSGYCLDPKTQEEFGRIFVELLTDNLRSDEIHGPGGFLDRVMEHTYGPGSAKLMRWLYLPRVYVEGLPAILPPQGREWFDYCRSERSTYDTPKVNHKWAGLFAAYETAGRQAEANVERCLASADFNEASREHTERLLAEVRFGRQLAFLAALEARLTAAAAQAGTEDMTPFKSKWKEAASEFRRREASPDNKEQQKRLDDLAAEFDKSFQEKLEVIPQATATLKHLAAENKRVRSDRVALRKRTLASIYFKTPTSLEDEIARCGKTRIALMGNVEKIDELLKKRGFVTVENIGSVSRELPDNLHAYGIVCLLDKRLPKLKPQQLARLEAFVDRGGGLLLTAHAPFYLAGNSRNLANLAVILGAEAHGDCSGGMTMLQKAYLTQDLPKQCFNTATYRTICIRSPLTGVPLARYNEGASDVPILANIHGKGRVVYLWQALGDTQNPSEHERLLLRSLCWLAGANEDSKNK